MRSIEGIGVIKQLYKYLPRKALIQIYKSFTCPHLDYCDFIYHRPTYDNFYSEHYFERASLVPVNTNYDFCNKSEAVQYNPTIKRRVWHISGKALL